MNLADIDIIEGNVETDAATYYAALQRVFPALAGMNRG